MTNKNWTSGCFYIAGCFMAINVVALWVRYFSDYQLSLLWAAVPAIVSLGAAVFGLFKLYGTASNYAPTLAKVAALCSLIACAALVLAATWIIAVIFFVKGALEPTPTGLLVLTIVFMITMVLAFFTNALAYLRQESVRKIGIILAVPVAVWALMLVVGIVKGFAYGLSLDHYTNAILAAAFLALAIQLNKCQGVD